MDGHRKALRRRLAAMAACLFVAGGALLCAAPSAAVSGETRMLVPVGRTFGVKLYAEGVMVVGLAEGAASGLKTGDVLLCVNDETLRSAGQLQALLQENGGDALTLSVRRGARLLTISAESEADEQGVYRLGAWVRDSMAGIGTMTYYDPESGAFGALGHGVTDPDTLRLVPLGEGTIMHAAVKAVQRGESGAPGELRGSFDLTHDCGTICANTDCGIFGTLERDAAESMGEAMPVATRGEVHAGAASILANCAGEEVCAYDAQIERVYSGANGTRDLLLRVTDETLLALTGGIVQGMSGSPILQDGKLVGAVTHVLVDDPTRGYGILIENMLAAGG